MEFVLTYLLCILACLAHSIIFGVATDVVIKNKGYYDNWFWWGFFFGTVALIVAWAKPQRITHGTPSRYSEAPFYKNTPTHDEQLLSDGGWACSCGMVNASYVSTCCCGKNKRDVQAAELEKSAKKD